MAAHLFFYLIFPVTQHERPNTIDVVSFLHMVLTYKLMRFQSHLFCVLFVVLIVILVLVLLLFVIALLGILVLFLLESIYWIDSLNL